MLTAEQTIATRRKYGGHRFPFVEAHDQHDWAKVNSRIGSVKMFFRTDRRNCRFRGRQYHAAAMGGTHRRSSGRPAAPSHIRANPFPGYELQRDEGISSGDMRRVVKRFLANGMHEMMQSH